MAFIILWRSSALPLCHNWQIAEVPHPLFHSAIIPQDVSLPHFCFALTAKDVQFCFLRPTYILRSNVGSYWSIIPKYVHTSNSLQDVTRNHWTMKLRSQWAVFVLRSRFGSYWLIFPNNDVYTLNSLLDIRQNHWIMKYTSQWPSFTFRSNVRSYWPIIPKYDVQTSNSLQDITQNHWTMKYRSTDLHLFWGQTSGHTES